MIESQTALPDPHAPALRDPMERAADAASDLLKSLANRNRLLILCALVKGERSVGQLAEALGLRDSTVSQHLALLRKDGLVAPRRAGQTIWYSIASVEAQRVLAVLYDIYCPTGPDICAPAPDKD